MVQTAGYRLVTHSFFSIMRILLILFLLLSPSSKLLAQSAPELITSLPSTNFVTGEVGYMNFIFVDRDLNSPPPENIVVPGLNIQRVGFMIHVENGRRHYIYNYRFVAVNPGSYTIPAVTFDFPGKEITSRPQQIKVIDRSELRPTVIEIGDQSFTYYSILFIEKSILYPGQTSQLEYKLYLPEYLRIMQWGLPTPRSLNNVTAWRFNIPEQESDIGNAILGGKGHQVASYQTVLTAGSPGKAKLGELKCKVVTAMSFVDSFQGNVVRRVDLPISHPATDFTVLPFPTTPPAGFQGAVGDFKLSAEIPTTAEMKESDTIKATLYVKGHGNLAELVAPPLENKDAWQVIDSSRIQQGDERKLNHGTAGFTYILKPLATTTATPGFQFSYFDPEKTKFITLTTPTSPLRVVPATPSASPAGVEVPTEDMRDIISALPDDLLQYSPPFWKSWPKWLWQLIPAACLFLMLAHQARVFLHHRKAGRASYHLKMQDLKQLASSKEPILKAAGQYIQKWLRPDQHPELQQILDERDSLCYQPGTQAAEPDSKRRREILKILKKCSLLAFFIALTGIDSARAADLRSHYSSDNYPEAIKELEQQLETHTTTSPDYSAIQFFLGRAYYRTAELGRAAYHFQLALNARPDFPEAQKNLSFIQRQMGSIIPQDEKLTGLDFWVAKFSPASYRQFSYGCLWLILLSVVYLKIYRPKGYKFAAALSASILAPLLLVASFYAEFQHPHQTTASSYTPAMVLKESPLLTEPIDYMPEDKKEHTLLNTPAASPCFLIADRGGWSYIQLANGMRGWIASEAVSSLDIQMHGSH